MAKSRAARAADPNTPLADLAALAHEHPAVRAAVAANPSTYPDLLAWLGGLGDPDVDAAIAARATANPDEITADAIKAADPTTSQIDLSALAHAHPELRAAIAANPNAYDDLHTWIAENPAPTTKDTKGAAEPGNEPPDAPPADVASTTTRRRPAASKAKAASEATTEKLEAKIPAETTVLKTAATETSEVIPPPPPTAPPAAPAPAPASPVAARTADPIRTSAAATRVAGTAYAASLVTTLLGLLTLAFPFNPWIPYVPLWAQIALAAVIVVAFAVAAVNADIGAGAKLGAILLALLGVGAGFLPLIAPLPLIPLATPFLLFLAWALVARFRGWGYFGIVLIALPIAASVGVGVWQVSIAFASGFAAAAAVLAVWTGLQPFIVIAIVAASRAFERAYSRRGTEVLP